MCLLWFLDLEESTLIIPFRALMRSIYMGEVGIWGCKPQHAHRVCGELTNKAKNKNVATMQRLYYNPNWLEFDKSANPLVKSISVSFSLIRS